MKRLGSLSRKVIRKLGSLPLKMMGQQLRAQALETLTDEMITSIAVPGGSLRFHTPSTLLLSRATSLLVKEPDTIQWINSFEDGAIFWDIGANVGVYTLYAAVCRRASVLAFEPSAANFHVLSKNIQINALYDRVTAYCIALSGETRLGFLNLDSSLMGSAINQFGNIGEISPYSVKVKPGAVQGMVGFTIDDFISQFGVPFPNYLKMDVDGLELDILQGANKTLQDPRLVSLLVELSLTNEDQYRNAAKLLNEAGFNLVAKGASQGTQAGEGANHLFARSNRKHSVAPMVR